MAPEMGTKGTFQYLLQKKYFNLSISYMELQRNKG